MLLRIILQVMQIMVLTADAGIALKGHLNVKVMMWLFLDQIAVKPKQTQLRITKKIINLVKLFSTISSRC